jgi:hypothetical protein
MPGSESARLALEETAKKRLDSRHRATAAIEGEAWPGEQ